MNSFPVSSPTPGVRVSPVCSGWEDKWAPCSVLAAVFLAFRLQLTPLCGLPGVLCVGVNLRGVVSCLPSSPFVSLSSCFRLFVSLCYSLARSREALRTCSAPASSRSRWNPTLLRPLFNTLNGNLSSPRFPLRSSALLFPAQSNSACPWMPQLAPRCLPSVLYMLTPTPPSKSPLQARRTAQCAPAVFPLPGSSCEPLPLGPSFFPPPRRGDCWLVPG